MKKYTTKLMSVLFTIVMLLSLLPVPAQAAGRDLVIEIPTTLAFTTEPQSGTVLNTEDYTVTWAINKAAYMIVLEIQETNRLTGATSWKQLKTLTGTSLATAVLAFHHLAGDGMPLPSQISDPCCQSCNAVLALCFQMGNRAVFQNVHQDQITLSCHIHSSSYFLCNILHTSQ